MKNKDEWFMIAVFIVVTGLYLFFTAPVRADGPSSLSPEQAKSIYAMAYGQCPTMEGMAKGCPVEWLHNPPAIELVHADYLCEKLNMAPGCRARGLYTEGTVYLDYSMDFSNALHASVVLHEFIHHFQLLRGSSPSTCDEWLALEREAYGIQARVLQRVGDWAGMEYVLRNARSLRCL